MGLPKNPPFGEVGRATFRGSPGMDQCIWGRGLLCHLLTLYSWGASWGVLTEGSGAQERETFVGLGAGPIY